MNRSEWNSLVDQYPEANFLQSWQWGEVHERLGDVVIRQEVIIDGKLAGGWQGIIKDARRGRYLEVPGGPLIDWNNTDAVQAVVAQLRKSADTHKAVFVRIRPQVLESEGINVTLRQAGFKKAPFHLHAEHTNIIDITNDEDMLMAALRKQTRYEVRQVEKKGLTISQHKGSDMITEFCDVQADTARRQGFVPSNRMFLEMLVKIFDDDARIYTAEKDGQLLNLALVIYHGNEADYFEAASTPEARSYPGAYGVLWAAVLDARRASKARYNLWGIAYSDDPNHRYAGVTTFKRGFGGDDTTYVSAHDLVLQPAKYIVNWAVETARRKKRKL